MNAVDFFSPNYFVARDRFLQAVADAGWESTAYPIAALGPQGEELTVDVAMSSREPLPTLIVSSGLHGIEGFFGSAVQLALIDRLSPGSLPGWRVLFLHALNPWGFVWRRRFDPTNVDLNRNFLLPGERYEGSPPGYAELNSLINPPRPPSRCDPFMLQAIWAIMKHGAPALRTAIAAGQYDFPQGLFFGGHQPSPLVQLLEQQLNGWLAGSQRVIHFDLHTGLGRSGDCKLLVDYPWGDAERARWVAWFGSDLSDLNQESRGGYQARGSFGCWCHFKRFAPNYFFAFAEVGTYASVRVIAGLRAENQLHHWSDDPPAVDAPAKLRLQELFCPRSARWRSRAVNACLRQIDRAVQALSTTR